MGARLTQLKILVNSVLDGTGTLIGKTPFSMVSVSCVMEIS